MAKAVLISIRPEWVDKILSGEKTLEIRKNRPTMQPPFRCYIYCTTGRKPWVLDGYPGIRQDGNVVAEFACDKIKPIFPDSFFVKEEAERVLAGSCLTSKQVIDYAGWKGKKIWDCKDLYRWYISNLKIYGKPKPLSEFKGLCKIEADCGCCHYYNYTKMDCDGRTIKRPPQSWCYVEELRNE